MTVIKEFNEGTGQWETIVVGEPGPQGPQGVQGYGIPAGGSVGQIIGKNSLADYDVRWIDPADIDLASVQYLWGGTNTTTDPGTGYMRISTISGENKRLSFDGFDADGFARNFGIMQVGDTVVVTDTTDPGSTIFARYLVTKEPVDMGGWFTIDALRTDTVGSTVEPPIGRSLVVTATFSAGSGGGGSDGFTYVTDSPPIDDEFTPLKAGQTWYDTSTGNSFLWLDDGTSEQWVQFAPGDSGADSVAVTKRGQTTMGANLTTGGPAVLFAGEPIDLLEFDVLPSDTLICSLSIYYDNSGGVGNAANFGAGIYDPAVGNSSVIPLGDITGGSFMAWYLEANPSNGTAAYTSSFIVPAGQAGIRRVSPIWLKTSTNGRAVGNPSVQTTWSVTHLRAGTGGGGSISTSVPAGSVQWFAGTAEPSGWSFFGKTIVNAQSLYPELWVSSPAAWKSGTDLVLPAAEGRTPITPESGQTTRDTVGETGGANTHVLTANELAPHIHAQSQSSAGTGGTQLVGSTASGSGQGLNGETYSGGGGWPHNIVQAFIVLNLMIKL